jgi:uncharacterized membrane protein YbhN (UPF0104 family)
MSGLWSAITSTAAVIGDANVGVVAAAFAIDTLSLLLMAFRWRLLLRSLGSRATLWETVLAYAGGVCVCNITPARTIGGDACRAALIRRGGGPPPVKAIAASVVYDRMTDVPGILVLAALAAPTLQPNSGRWAILAVLTLVAAIVARPLWRRLMARLGAWHQAVIGRDVGAAAISAVGCSLLIWTFDITRVMLVGIAFGVRFDPSQAAAISLLRLGSGLVPVPAGIGVVDGALVAGFIWLGLPPPTAAALAIVERAIVYGWGTALGAAALLLLGGSRAVQKTRSGAAPELSSDASL